MGRMLARVALLAGVVAVLAAGVLRFIAAPRVDASMNEVFPHEPWPVSARAAEIHEGLKVADLHADTLLWRRSPLQRHDYGHTDFPRFREGGVALQVFTAVTKTPRNMNYDTNEGGSDDITLLALAQGWPIDTWTSIEARARYQARRLHRLQAADANFFVVASRQDLQDLLARHDRNPLTLGGILGVEGSHVLEGDLDAIDRLYTEGYRVMGLQHFFDNELGGSLHGRDKEGLTSFGRAAIERMAALGMVIDLAHSSEAVVEETLARTTAPVIVSHTGIKSLCDSPRNIRDELLRAVALRGGLIGIGFWDDAVCDATPGGLAATIEEAIGLFGEDAIALGSDFDGTVTTYFDVSQMAALTHALHARGLTREQIEKVMGGNQINFFLKHLPEATAATP